MGYHVSPLLLSDELEDTTEETPRGNPGGCNHESADGNPCGCSVGGGKKMRPYRKKLLRETRAMQEERDSINRARLNAGLHPQSQGERECLSCQKPFISPNMLLIRICDACKGNDAWVGDRSEVRRENRKRK